jgi:hypothetical protein
MIGGSAEHPNLHVSEQRQLNSFAKRQMKPQGCEAT